MNYEQMLNSLDGAMQHKEQLPWGTFYRKMIERKYRYVVSLKPELTDSLVFCEALRHDQQTQAKLNDKCLMAYELHEDSGGIYEMELLSGNYQTLAQIIDSNPAIVAQRGFVDSIINNIIDVTDKLHANGIYHLCYAPQTIFIRKGDNMPMLLCHGSSFLSMKNQSALYDGFTDMVAPEVLNDGKGDERSDVYALGRLIEWIYGSSGLPFEYKTVVKKATQDDPEQRYHAITDMRATASKRKGIMHTSLLMLAACLLVAFAVWAFFEFVPETTVVEFVDDNGLKDKGDPFAENYDDSYIDDMAPYTDPETDMFIDSIGPMTDEEVQRLSDSINTVQMAEHVFKHQFEDAVRRQLAPLYQADPSGMSETDYIAKSGKVIDELMNSVEPMSNGTGIPLDKASTIATQIISKVQEEMNKQVVRNATRTKPDSNE